MHTISSTTMHPATTRTHIKGLLHSSWIWWILISLLVVGPCVAAAASAGHSAIPTASAGIIEAPVLMFEIRTSLSSSRLNGTKMYFHPSIAGAALPQSSRPDGLLQINLMLPHKNDDITGCSGAWNKTNEFGETFENAFILLMAGSCSSINTYSVAAKSGAAGILVYGCPPEKPYNCDPRLSTAFSLVPSQGHRPPMVSIDSANGNALVSFLKSNLNSTVAPPIDSLQILIKAPGFIAPEDKAALIAITNQTRMGSFVASYADQISAWSIELLQDPSLDVCANRTIDGIWCELGHVVLIDLYYHDWQLAVDGIIPVEFGALSKLAYLSVVENRFNGPIPPEWCSLTNMQSIRVLSSMSGNGGGGLTSFPECNRSATWMNLRLLQFDGNNITALPNGLDQLTTLEILRGSGNSIQRLPSLVNLTRLAIIDFSSNHMVELPAFSPGSPNLIQIGFSSNQISVPIPPAAFDGMSALQILDLNTNQITGPLPNFMGCSSLQVIDLSSQRDLVTNMGGFNGSMPASWQFLMSVEELYLQENSLLSPVYTSSMLSLEKLDLSHNYLTTAIPSDPFNTNPSTFLGLVLSPSMTSMRLSYNQLAGELTGASGILLSTTLNEIYLDHNQLTSIFNVFIAATPFTAIDFSYNNITLENNAFPDGQPSSRLLYLNFRGNPYLRIDALPSWLTIGSTLGREPGASYACASFTATTAPLLAFDADASFYSYQHCQCAQGTFGRPPLCHSIPNAATLNPRHVITSSEVGDDFANFVSSVRAVGSDLTVPHTSNYSRAFSDSMYGENRATLGMTTVWEIDVTTEYEDDPELYVNAGYQPPVPLHTFTINTTADTPSPLWTPVRMITVRLHVSATEFNDFNDVISIYEGASDLKGNRVFTMRGTDTKSTVISTVYTNSPAYLLANNASIAQISDPRLYEIQVFSSTASVQFTSRAITGLHFYATYSYDFTCPDGYFYNRDVTPNQCHINLNEYHVGLPIRSAVFAVSSMTIIFILINIVVLMWFWNSPIYKAASRVFMLVILVLLLCMGLGSLLYASIPNVNSTGSAICIGRAWLTCLPLTGILGVLLAKTNRLNSIFGATTLQVKRLSDLDIAKTVIFVCALQITLLGVFGGLPLSRAQLAVGHGSVSDRLVYSCSQESGFMIWMGIEIAYIACLMLPAAYLGYKTRNLPSQYNESSHIQNAIVLLIFFGIIIVPLDIFIQDSPDAAVLIQGLGQGFMCAMMTLILFGPKLYYLVQFDHSKKVNAGTRISHGDKAKNNKKVVSKSIADAQTSSIHTQAVPPTDGTTPVPPIATHDHRTVSSMTMPKHQLQSPQPSKAGGDHLPIPLHPLRKSTPSITTYASASLNHLRQPSLPRLHSNTMTGPSLELQSPRTSSLPTLAPSSNTASPFGVANLSIPVPITPSSVAVADLSKHQPPLDVAAIIVVSPVEEETSTEVQSISPPLPATAPTPLVPAGSPSPSRPTTALPSFPLTSPYSSSPIILHTIPSNPSSSNIASSSSPADISASNSESATPSVAAPQPTPSPTAATRTIIIHRSPSLTSSPNH